jgi:hypothetical protein
LITDLHNSNKTTIQVNLLGEKIGEEQFCLLGFVVGEDVKLNKYVWFAILNNVQIDLVNKALQKKQSW